MKIRLGNIANSSSTCFMLDLRTSGVQHIVDEVIGAFIHAPRGLNRCSAIATAGDFPGGVSLRDYIKEYSAEIIGYEEILGDDFLNWMQEWEDKLDKNVVFIRSSDENMGGEVPLLGLIKILSVSEMDYH